MAGIVRRVRITVVPSPIGPPEQGARELDVEVQVDGHTYRKTEVLLRDDTHCFLDFVLDKMVAEVKRAIREGK